MSKDIDSIVRTFLTNPLFQTSESNYPPYDMFFEREKNQYVVDVAVAGWRPEQIKVETVGDRLTITGRVDQEEKGVRTNYAHQGIAKRDFVRSFKMDATLDRDGIAVTLESGILRVVIPLKETKSTNKTIEIKVV